jgi:hypothetical protein
VVIVELDREIEAVVMAKVSFFVVDECPLGGF